MWRNDGCRGALALSIVADSRCSATARPHGVRLLTQHTIHQGAHRFSIPDPVAQMKKILTALVLLTLGMRPVAAQGTSVVGRWKAEFDTQVGPQKYLYTITQEGAALTGVANAEMGGEKRDVVLHDVKVSHDTLTFSETIEFQGNSIPITYVGVVAGDQITFTRKVGDFATETFVAKREKGGA